MSEHLQSEHEGELRDLVRGVLARNPYFNGRDLRVDFEHDDVVIRGAVRSYYHKQVAQESVRKIDGIRSIRNELEVINELEEIGV